MAPRETENNAYVTFWGDKRRALWYVMVFSGVVNCCNNDLEGIRINKYSKLGVLQCRHDPLEDTT